MLRSSGDIPIPTNENERLQELDYYDILDTRPEQTFNRLTEIAQEILDVPIAGISFVSQNRQWFKACVGFGKQETDREISFCTYAILQDNVFKVPDVTESRLFENNPLVQGEPYIRSYYGAPLITENGNALGSFCVMDREPRHFSEAELNVLELLRDQAMLHLKNRLQYRQVEKQTRTDPLTDLPNRMEFFKKLDEQIEEAEKRNHELVLMKIQVENVRRMNDVFGQEAGNEILKEVANQLKAYQKQENMICGRLVGASFGVIHTSDDTDQNQVQSFVEDLHKHLTREMTLKNNSFQIMCRIGYALYPLHSTDRDELFSMSEEALQNTSLEEIDQINMYVSDFELTDWEAVSLESNFRKALEQDSIELHYQPFVSLHSEPEITGMEALIRWQLPNHGYIPPPSIINIARNQGAMGKLGRWVLRTACQDIARWNEEMDRDLTVSVNVSAMEFLCPETYVNSVEDILQTSPISRKNLQLEITETEAMKDISITKKNMSALKDMNVRLALDDFGTGYSSLRYLSDLPVDLLKIDKSFTWTVEDDEPSRELIKHMIQMANSLNLVTLAEGIETEEQLEQLNRLGCDQFQGFYISEPLPPDSLKSFFENYVQN